MSLYEQKKKKIRLIRRIFLWRDNTHAIEKFIETKKWNHGPHLRQMHWHENDSASVALYKNKSKSIITRINSLLERGEKYEIKNSSSGFSVFLVSICPAQPSPAHTKTTCDELSSSNYFGWGLTGLTKKASMTHLKETNTSPTRIDRQKNRRDRNRYTYTVDGRYMERVSNYIMSITVNYID